VRVAGPLVIASGFGHNRHVDDGSNPASLEDEALAPRLTMRQILHDLSERFLNLESGWLRTVRDLTVDPGPMIRRYVRGRRRIYANPFSYLVIVTAAGYLVQRMVGYNERIVATAQDSVLDSPLQMEFVSHFAELMLNHTIWVSFGILVPLAIMVRLLFRGSGYNLAENLVFALYVVGHTTALGCVLLPLLVLLPPSQVVQPVISVVVACAYTVYAARGFFPGGFLSLTVKMVVGYLVAYGVFMVVMTVCILVYVVGVLLPNSPRVDWDLVTAADYGLAAVIDKVLSEGGDVNMTLGRTALHVAAEHGNLEIVDLLLDHGADVNLQDVHGRVPMFIALSQRHEEVARRLAEAGTNPRVRTVDGSTLLIEAARIDDLDLVRWALKHGVEVNAVRPKKRFATALMMAAGDGNLEMVRLLLASGADPSIGNRDGLTALDLARGKAVKELLRDAAAAPPPG
jgi:hypothetical protein